MKNTEKPTGLKRRLYLVYHQDGLLEIVVGVFLLILGAVVLTERFAFIGLTGIPAALYLPLKQSVSLPRVGHIRFVSEDESRRRLGLTMLIGLAVFVGLLALFFVARSGTLTSDAAAPFWGSLPVVLASLLCVGLAGVAYLLNHRLFYLFGLLGVLLVFSFAALGGPMGIPIALLGTVIAASGGWRLMRFIRKHPARGDSLNG